MKVVSFQLNVEVSNDTDLLVVENAVVQALRNEDSGLVQEFVDDFELTRRYAMLRKLRDRS